MVSNPVFRFKLLPAITNPTIIIILKRSREIPRVKQFFVSFLSKDFSANHTIIPPTNPRNIGSEYHHLFVIFGILECTLKIPANAGEIVSHQFIQKILGFEFNCIN